MHRSRDEPIDNDTLIAALLSDRDRYRLETPQVPSPDAIVVSGDLIQGAALNSANWDSEMRDQYAVAEGFLDQLVKRFLGGDRSKLIMIPGNHDVCWNSSLAGMTRIEEADYPNNVRSVLLEPDSKYRWSWNERSLYRIHDDAAYAKRMDAYWDFVRRFYYGVSLLAPIDPDRGYQLFEICDRRIVVAAFDSIAGNDCFGYGGAIPRGAVARADLALRDISHLHDLRIAVWHHSIQGAPLREDYMDVSQVHEMAGLHFQLGMHGHQHVAAATTHYVYLNEAQSMAVISAGSLCAGSRELPRGTNRQYNIVVVEDDFRSARVHVREMVEGEQFSRKRNGAFPEGYVEIAWQAPLNTVGQTIDIKRNNMTRLTLRVEELLNDDPRKALELATGVNLERDSYLRKISILAAQKLDDPKLILSTIQEPFSAEEAIFKVGALIQIKQFDEADKLLSEWNDIDSTTREAIRSELTVKKAMSGV